MPKGLVVAAVHEGSIAEEMEIVPGDRILAVDDQEVTDIVDFQYLTAEEEFTLLVEKQDGEVWELDIERAPGEVLGLEVQAVSAKGLKLCRNNCIFCFVSQMPKGMRASLYDKDDDYRLSLTQGSFITLSNLSGEEFERILRLHLSPLYISVHAWDREARVRLMKNPQAGDIAEQLQRLAQAGLTIHSQIVLVPDYNDGEILRQTVAELAKLYPSVQSIAVVPVGLTKYRENLTPLRPFTPDEARMIIRQAEEWQKKFYLETGRHLVYLSDEFYALASMDFPEPFVYDDFPQLENGVGMASKFFAEFNKAWTLLPTGIPERRMHLITGMSAKPFFDKLKKRLDSIKGLELIVHAIRNDFFGPTVTVAGLLTAQDIAEQIGNLNGEEFLIPTVMLKADEDVFLDNRDVAWLEKQIKGKARVVENNGVAFLESITGIPLEVEKLE